MPKDDFKLEFFDKAPEYLQMSPMQGPQGKWSIRMLAGSTTLCTSMSNYNDAGEIIYEWNHGPVDHLQFFNRNVSPGYFKATHTRGLS